MTYCCAFYKLSVLVQVCATSPFGRSMARTGRMASRVSYLTLQASFTNGYGFLNGPAHYTILDATPSHAVPHDTPVHPVFSGYRNILDSSRWFQRFVNFPIYLGFPLFFDFLFLFSFFSFSFFLLFILFFYFLFLFYFF